MSTTIGPAPSPGGVNCVVSSSSGSTEGRDSLLERVKTLKFQLREEPSNQEVKEELRGILHRTYLKQDEVLSSTLPAECMRVIIESGDHGKAVDALHRLRLSRPAHLLHYIKPLSVHMKSIDSTAILAAGWVLLHYIVTEEEQDGANSLASQNYQTLHIDKPFRESQQVVVLRDAVRDSWSFDELHTSAKAMLRAGVQDEKGSNQVYKDRGLALMAMLGVLEGIGELQDANFLEIIEICMNAVGHPKLPMAAVRTIGIVADRRRRKGLKVKALKSSHKLVKCMNAMMGLVEEGHFETQVSAALTNILHLLADKERSEKDYVNFNLICEGLLESFLADFDNPSQWYVGLFGLNCVWLADREAAKTFLEKSNMLNLITTAATRVETRAKNLQEMAASFLMKAMEFPDLRTLIIEGGGLKVLVDLCKEPTLACHVGASLASLCVHQEAVRAQLFQMVDFFALLQDILRDADLSVSSGKLTEEQTKRVSAVLEILFFLSMHGVFKNKLMEKSHSSVLHSLGELATFLNSKDSKPVDRYLFACVVLNLARSREDKDVVDRKKKPGGVQLDDSQLAELEMLYEKLPLEAKPAQNGEVDLGSKALAQSLRKQILELKLVHSYSRLVASLPVSRAVLKTICLTLNLLCCNVELRGNVIAQGGLRLLLKGAADLTDDEQRRTRQAVAQLCITTDPSLLSYQDKLDAVPHIVALLGDHYELYQYEAALALTNLVSTTDEIRNRAWRGGAWQAFGQLLFSDNDMLRSAGMEGWCNMTNCDLVLEQIQQGRLTTDIQLLFAFCAEHCNPRAQSAAAGALAILSGTQVVEQLAKAPNVKNIRDLYKSTKDAGLIERCQVCIENLDKCLK